MGRRSLPARWQRVAPSCKVTSGRSQKQADRGENAVPAHCAGSYFPFPRPVADSNVT